MPRSRKDPGLAARGLSTFLPGNHEGNGSGHALPDRSLCLTDSLSRMEKQNLDGFCRETSYTLVVDVDERTAPIQHQQPSAS